MAPRGVAVDSATKLPVGFRERIERIFGPSYARDVLATFEPRPTTFRVNTLKTTSDAALEALQREGFKLSRVSWSREAFILKAGKERDLQKHSLFVNGKIYLQSLASMLPPLLLGVQPGERVLDMTAAPGSKTSQLAALMRGQGSLVAVEKNKIRYERLVHNLTLLGVSTIEGFCAVHHADAIEFCEQALARGESFDRILLDAPCSAEARFHRGDSRTFGFWGPEGIAENARLQLRLLRAGAAVLKPGGVLAYSTCTLAPEENELLVSSVVSAAQAGLKVEPAPALAGLRVVPVLSKWGNTSVHPSVRGCVRSYPTLEIESFFVARLRKALS